MNATPDTIRVVIPLTIRKRNGRPKILPPDDLTSRDRSQDPHVLRAIARAWSWRRQLETGAASTIQDIAAAEKVSDRFVSRMMRLAYLSPEVLEHLVIRRMPPALSLNDLVAVADRPWAEQIGAVFQGLRVMPKTCFEVLPLSLNSGVLVLPVTIAARASSREFNGSVVSGMKSRNASALMVVRTPATSVRSLTPIGRSASAARARSGRRVTMALTPSSTASVRASEASSTSDADKATTSVALSTQSSGPEKRVAGWFSMGILHL
jgi:hypothetical protein